VSNTKRAGAIIGKINANPNPIPFGQGGVLISWETNDPAGAAVRVSTSPGEEKVVSQGRSKRGYRDLLAGAIGCWMSFVLDRAIPAAGVLAFNSEFEVLMANSYLNHYHQEELKAAFPDLLSWGGGSLWMRRKLPLRLTGSGDKSKGTKLKKRRDVT
jgi:hypothetical protein